MRVLYLKADAQILEERLERRTGHFMPASLLQSQLQTLEEPDLDEHPIIVSVNGTLEQTINAALAGLQKTHP